MMSRRNGAENRRRGRSPGRTSELPVLEDGLYLSEEDEEALQHRLSRLEGQVRGIKRMLAEHQSCDDILVQVAALKQAVNGVASELVQAHMATCVLGRIKAGRGAEAVESLKAALGRVLKYA
jgi:DNA-binding FrmR family transcriptional regulator